MDAIVTFHSLDSSGSPISFAPERFAAFVRAQLEAGIEIVPLAALESVSGRSLSRLFRERVAEPLELPRAGFATRPAELSDAAATERGNAYEREMAGALGRGHAWRTQLIRGDVHDANAHGLGGAAGHAGLFGTVEEVARLARELLDAHAARRISAGVTAWRQPAISSWEHWQTRLLQQLGEDDRLLSEAQELR